MKSPPTALACVLHCFDGILLVSCGQGLKRETLVDQRGYNDDSLESVGVLSLFLKVMDDTKTSFSSIFSVKSGIFTVDFFNHLDM